MASGPVSRTDRPNTWLLRPALRRAQSLDRLEDLLHRNRALALRVRLSMERTGEEDGHQGYARAGCHAHDHEGLHFDSKAPVILKTLRGLSNRPHDCRSGPSPSAPMR